MTRTLKELLEIKEEYINLKRITLISLKKEFLNREDFRKAANKWMSENRPNFTNEEKERINVWFESHSLPFDNLMSTDELAAETGKQVRRIQQLAPDLIDAGFAKRFGRTIVFQRSAIEYINSLPETRGRKKR